MTIKINREDFLHRLQSIQPGLSAKDILEQSSSYIFRSGIVYSYNDELMCRTRSGLDKDFVGVIKAKSLVAILEKLPEDELEVEVSKETFSLLGSGKRRRVDLALETQISDQMNIAEAVETPNKDSWKPLHKDFCTAISTVQQCAKRIASPSEFVFTCVHIHPRWVEASDDLQFCRWKLKTGISTSTLVRYSSIKHISDLGMEEFAETETWLHFRNKSRLTLSCRRWIEGYEIPNYDLFLDAANTTKTTFPKGIARAAEIGQTFTSENSDEACVLVSMSQQYGVKLKAVGLSGKFTEDFRKAKYKGPSIEFEIPPKLLIQVIDKHNDFLVSDRKLRVDGENWVYVTVLGQPQEESSDVITRNVEAETKIKSQKRVRREE